MAPSLPRGEFLCLAAHAFLSSSFSPCGRRWRVATDEGGFVFRGLYASRGVPCLSRRAKTALFQTLPLRRGAGLPAARPWLAIFFSHVYMDTSHWRGCRGSRHSLRRRQERRASAATNGGFFYMPRGAFRVCHDALNPRCSKHCPCGGALGCQRLACLLAILFSHFYMGTFHWRGCRGRLRRSRRRLFLYASRGVSCLSRRAKPALFQTLPLRQRAGLPAARMSARFILFPFFIWTRPSGGDAGEEAGIACDGGA